MTGIWSRKCLIEDHTVAGEALHPLAQQARFEATTLRIPEVLVEHLHHFFLDVLNSPLCFQFMGMLHDQIFHVQRDCPGIIAQFRHFPFLTRFHWPFCAHIRCLLGSSLLLCLLQAANCVFIILWRLLLPLLERSTWPAFSISIRQLGHLFLQTCLCLIHRTDKSTPFQLLAELWVVELERLEDRICYDTIVRRALHNPAFKFQLRFCLTGCQKWGQGLQEKVLQSVQCGQTLVHLQSATAHYSYSLRPLINTKTNTVKETTSHSKTQSPLRGIDYLLFDWGSPNDSNCVLNFQQQTWWRLPVFPGSSFWICCASFLVWTTVLDPAPADSFNVSKAFVLCFVLGSNFWMICTKHCK